MVDASRSAVPLWRMRFGEVASLAAVALCVPALLLIAVRLLHLEHLQGVVIAETMTVAIFAPVYLAALIALAFKRRVVAPAAITLVILQLFWLWPDIAPRQAVNPPAGSTPVRILTHNVLGGLNETPGAMAKEIQEEDPDIIVLQEAGPAFVTKLEQTRAMSSYRWVSTGQSRTHGLVTYSRFPLGKPVITNNIARAVAYELEINSRKLTLFNVHPPAPAITTNDRWLDAQEALRDELHARDGTVLAIGDFNATFAHRPFRNTVSNGYREAHAEVGRGWARTWPVDGPLAGKIGNRVGGLVRIDHVLAKGDVIFVDAHETTGSGSDHRGLVVDIAVSPT